MKRNSLLLFVTLLISGCAITHEYGPYMGKVVDKDTRYPVAGAVVFIKFSTQSPNVGGYSTHYADSVETLTGDDGEFLIPAYRINTFRLMHGWGKHPRVIIFKPGYGAYPLHRGTEPHFGYGTIPEGKHVKIELPKLKTRKERRDNLSDLWVGAGVPHNKYRILNEIETRERVEIGLQP